MSFRVPRAAHRESTGPHSRSRALAIGCGCVVLLIGITVLVGWCCHSIAVERIIAGLPAMTAWTAIGLSCGGVALIGATSPRWNRLGRCFAAVTALIGLLVLFEYLVTPIGIDQLLFTASSGTDPGRPSPQTASCLLFLGSALATVRLTPGWRRVHYGLLAGTATIVLFVTVGYVFGVVALRGVSGSDGVALHTLVGLILLTVGTTALLPDNQFVALARGRGSSAVVARALVGLGITPVIIGGTLFYLLQAHALGPRVALTLFTVTMMVLLGLLSAPLIIKVHNAEAGMRELTSQLQALFDNAPAALSLRDSAGRYLQVNRYGAAIVGKRAEELIGQTPPPPVDGGGALVDDREIARSGQSVSHDERIVRADGEVRDYHLVRYPVVENGQVRAFGTFGVDVTEHRRTVRELELAQTRFRSAFDEAPIGMMVQALDGEVQEVNPALCALVGRAPEELLSAGTASFITAEDRIVEATARAELLDGTGRSRTLELHYETDGDQRFPVDVHLTLVRNSDGAPQHYLVQVQDVTERRRYEQELEFLADHDPLTNLLNRRAFLRTLDRNKRHGDQAGAVIVFDLDSLKEVNDAHGHHAGDELIIAAATISRDQLRSTDVIARLGGDEFAVLLPGTSPDSAAAVAHHLLAALNTRSNGPGAPPSPIRASVGVSGFGSTMTDSSALVLQRADFAMYEAKREGGNRVRVASAVANTPLLRTEASI